MNAEQPKKRKRERKAITPEVREAAKEKARQSNADRVRIIGKRTVSPTDPPVIIYRAMCYYRDLYRKTQYEMGKEAWLKEIRNERKIKQLRKEARQRVRVAKGLPKKAKPKEKAKVVRHRIRIDRVDLTQILYLADVVDQALKGTKLKQPVNGFLYAALLCDAYSRPVMTADMFAVRMGSHMRSMPRKRTAGQLLYNMAEIGLLGKLDKKEQLNRYFITEKGKDYVRMVLAGANMVLTRNWRLPDQEIVIDEDE